MSRYNKNLRNYEYKKNDRNYYYHSDSFSDKFGEFLGIGYGVLVGVPIGILTICGIFIILPVWGKILFALFFIVPLLIRIKIYTEKHLQKIFIADTPFGRGKCQIRKRRGQKFIFIYFKKTFRNSDIKRNFFTWLFEGFSAKYSKLMIVSGNNNYIEKTFQKIKNEKYFDYEYAKAYYGLTVQIHDLYQKPSMLNINEANIAQLTQLPFMDKNKALKVILHIQKNGELDSVWQFAKIAELSQKQTDVILKRVYIQKTEIKEPVTFEEIKKELLDNDNSLDIL